MRQQPFIGIPHGILLYFLATTQALDINFALKYLKILFYLNTHKKRILYVIGLYVHLCISMHLKLSLSLMSNQNNMNGHILL